MATGETVTIACKLPNGLHLDAKANSGEKIRITLRGWAGARRLESAGNILDSHGRSVRGNYGVTEGVSKDLWDMLEKEFKEGKYQPYVQGLIWALPKTDSVLSRATEMAEVKSGLEAITPKSTTDKPGVVSTATKDD